MSGERPADHEQVAEERCPTCGQAVRVVTGDEGTSHFERAAESRALKAEQERDARPDLTREEMAALDSAVVWVDYGDVPEHMRSALYEAAEKLRARLSHNPEENPDA